MKAVFVSRRLLPEGGLSLATFRLAAALVEQGHEAEVVHSAGEPPAEFAGLARRIAADGEGDGVAPARLSRELERLDPSLLLVATPLADDLEAARAAGPTLLHTHLHTGVCADRSRYWSHLRRPCGVKAGRKCAVLRPLLGCGDLKETVSLARIAEQGRILAALREGGAGVLCVSSDQAELYRGHGVPGDRVGVLPNLGLRVGAGELAAAAEATPVQWRRATAFFGRLSKQKGGQVLAPLAAALQPEARLRVFGEGYMEARLAAELPAGVLCGQISQEAVTGVLMWARSVLFPSLWPEPGGIVGLDAQLIGVPLAAFAVGAPRFWPDAELFEPGDVEAMAAWLSEQEPRELSRDPEAVAAAQAEYWARVGSYGAELLAEFASAARFAAGDGPAERLISACAGVSLGRPSSRSG